MNRLSPMLAYEEMQWCDKHIAEGNESLHYNSAYRKQLEFTEGTAVYYKINEVEHQSIVTRTNKERTLIYTNDGNVWTNGVSIIKTPEGWTTSHCTSVRLTK